MSKAELIIKKQVLQAGISKLEMFMDWYLLYKHDSFIYADLCNLFSELTEKKKILEKEINEL